jgi:SulP family sulfate permease
LIYLYRSSTDIRLVELVPEADGSILEQPAPGKLPHNDVTILRVYGSMHFSGAAMLEETLPPAQDSEGSAVILQLRGLDNAGSTFIRVVERYAQQLQAHGGKLFLTGIHPRVLKQLELTETTDTIPKEDIFMAEERLGVSTLRAAASARKWLEQVRKELDTEPGNEVEDDTE